MAFLFSVSVLSQISRITSSQDPSLSYICRYYFMISHSQIQRIKTWTYHFWGAQLYPQQAVGEEVRVIGEMPEWREPSQRRALGGRVYRGKALSVPPEMKSFFRSSSLSAVPSFWTHSCTPIGRFAPSSDCLHLGDCDWVFVHCPFLAFLINVQV